MERLNEYDAKCLGEGSALVHGTGRRGDKIGLASDSIDGVRSSPRKDEVEVDCKLGTK